MTAIEIPQVYRKRASSFSQAPEGRQVGHVWGISSESKRVPSFFLLMFSIETWSRCGISIALPIRSVDPLWGLSVWSTHVSIHMPPRWG